jgi:hypothetical protein
MAREGVAGQRCPKCRDDGLIEDTESILWPCYNCGGSVIIADDPAEQTYRVWRVALAGAMPDDLMAPWEEIKGTPEHEAFKRVAAALQNPLLTRLQAAERKLKALGHCGGEGWDLIRVEG